MELEIRLLLYSELLGYALFKSKTSAEWTRVVSFCELKIVTIINQIESC